MPAIALTNLLPPWALRLLHLNYVRYGIVSVLALGLDTLTLLVLHYWGWAAWLSAAAAYLLGAVLHWMLSIRYVFDKPRDRADYLRKLMQYIGAGLVGVLLTMLIVESATGLLGLNILLAKIIAVLVVFNVVYLVRKFAIMRTASSYTPPTTNQKG
jgi:putative flippase GtrA